MVGMNCGISRREKVKDGRNEKNNCGKGHRNDNETIKMEIPWT